MRWMMGWFVVACATPKGALPLVLPDVPALEPASSLAYPIRHGQTLSGIAAACGVEGGALQLAAWNRAMVTDLDHIVAGRRLLVPVGTTCDVPLERAAYPRFTENWSSCTLDWQDLVLRNDSGVDEGDAARVDAYMAGEVYCFEAPGGLEGCTRRYGTPGLLLKRGNEVLLRYDEPQGSWAGPGHWAMKDLDADGKDEFVFVQPLGWSLGISLHYFETVVVGGEAGQLFAQGSILARPSHWLDAGDGRCDLLLVNTASLDDPIRGSGTYVVGERLRWKDGTFSPAPRETFPAQRMLNSFFDRYDFSEGDPLDWFLDGTAEARPSAEWR